MLVGFPILVCLTAVATGSCKTLQTWVQEEGSIENKLMDVLFSVVIVLKMKPLMNQARHKAPSKGHDHLGFT